MGVPLPVGAPFSRWPGSEGRRQELRPGGSTQQGSRTLTDSTKYSIKCVLLKYAAYNTGAPCDWMDG